MQQDAACEHIARLLLEEDVAKEPVERLVRLAALAAQRDERRAAAQRFEHARSILLDRCRADNPQSEERKLLEFCERALVRLHADEDRQNPSHSLVGVQESGEDRVLRSSKSGGEDLLQLYIQ